MDRAGWLTMILSISAVLTLVSFCFYRVLTLPPTGEESIEGPATIDPGDTLNPD